VRFSYSIEDAARAGLTGRATWKAHPKQMLSARAKSVLATMVYPDLVGNLYDPDEAQDIRESQRSYRVEEPVVATIPEAVVVEQPRVTVEQPRTEPAERSAAFVAAANAIEEAESMEALGAVAKRVKDAAAVLSPAENSELRSLYLQKRAVLGGAK
jgi:hypothetical protein